jgi:membrane-bound lytic murein transglycosylase A
MTTTPRLAGRDAERVGPAIEPMHSSERTGPAASAIARTLAMAALVALAACQTVPPAPTPTPVPPPTPTPAPTGRPVLVPDAWSSLPGWSDDAVQEAWPAFLASCGALGKRPAWSGVCTAARTIDGGDPVAVRAFFESRFVPNHVTTTEGNDTGLVTGYYEPLLHGSRARGATFATPLYGVPDDLLTVDLTSLYPELKGKRVRGKLVGRTVVPYPARGDLEQSGALRGTELVWVDDPVEAFFLEIQGSGRVELQRPDGGVDTVRLAYADQNGQPYRSIGRWLVDRGELTLSQASMQSIKAWALAHPDRRDELLWSNPSEVFFKLEPIDDPSRGPKGALGVPLTPRRSIAVDAKIVPLGSPVFLATTMPQSDAPLARLVMAQDTGGAIAAASGGAVRADFFWGFGADAAAQAGRMKQQGRMWVLVPR